MYGRRYVRGPCTVCVLRAPYAHGLRCCRWRAGGPALLWQTGYAVECGAAGGGAVEGGAVERGADEGGAGERDADERVTDERDGAAG